MNRQFRIPEVYLNCQNHFGGDEKTTSHKKLASFPGGEFKQLRSNGGFEKIPRGSEAWENSWIQQVEGWGILANAAIHLTGLQPPKKTNSETEPTPETTVSAAWKMSFFFGNGFFFLMQTANR